MFDDEVEADESYFGGYRKGRRGRGAAGKVAVFGLLKRNGKVYTVAVPNTQTATLLPIIREQVKPDSIVYTDCYKSYDVPDVSEFSHLRINHSTHFAERQNHINGIENFWNQAKRHLRKFNGIPKEHFELYLKEYEWRFNNSEIKVQSSILKQLVKQDLPSYLGQPQEIWHTDCHTAKQNGHIQSTGKFIKSDKQTNKSILFIAT